MNSVTNNSINTDTFLKMNVSFDTMCIKHTFLEKDVHFGIVDLYAPKTFANKQNLHFVFTVDCSGSMSDRCRDNRSKMQHILHTLKNILYFLNENCTEDSVIYVSVFAFDNRIHTIFQNIKVDLDTIDFMIHKVECIRPCDNTNIELALQNARAHIQNVKNEFPHFQIHHLFMTDGQPTAGNESPNILKDLVFVDNDIFNYFIGFGIDHNAELLCALGKVENSNYYFIDTLENAGLVYGEILHNILYESMNHLVLNVENGLIYNWETNSWNKQLYLQSVSSESRKTFHIITEHLYDCVILISGNMNIDNSNTPFTLNVNRANFIFDNPDLIKYLFRQRTMELLYEVKNFKDTTYSDNTQTFDFNNSDHSPTAEDLANLFERKRNNLNVKTEKRKQLLKKMKKFILELKKFIQSNHFQDDLFLNNLCDDIYIAYKTFNTAYCDMYVTTRQISQGCQRSYNVTQIPNHISTPFNSSNQLDTQMLFDIDDVPTSPTKISIPQRRLFFDDLDDNRLHVDHQISNNITSPYTTPHVLKVMNNISSNNSNRAPHFSYYQDDLYLSDSTLNIDKNSDSDDDSDLNII